MKTILLTGCAGFIGARTTEMLLAQGYHVIGIDNLNDAYDVRLKEWRLAQLVDQRAFTFCHLDICNRPALADVMERAVAQGERPDAVINLAARAGVRQSVADPWIYHETNATGTLNLLAQCQEYGIPKFVLASTSSLYGAHNPRPYSEDADTDRPLSPYAASKKAAEALCYTYHHLHGLDVTVVRYFTVYGPAGRPDMSLFRFVQWVSEGRPVTIYGDGSQSRDFTYVDDIAAGTVAALKPVGYEIINLGSDQPAVLNDVLAMVEERVGRKAERIHQPLHRADVMATWADISKAARLLAWQPRYTIENGVEQLVRWYRDNRSWAQSISTD